MLNDKVIILPRKRINQTLRKAIASYPLTVLIAPMGYGKTIAFESLAKSGKQRSIYLSFNQPTDNAAYIWDSLCAQLDAQGERLARLLRGLGLPQSSVETERVLDHIKNSVDNKKVLIALDDYHFTESPVFDAFLERLVREKIPGLRLLLLSRTRPNLNLDELAMKGLSQLYGHDLIVFSEEETYAFFEMHGIREKAIGHYAWTISEGWAAALWLYAKSFRLHHSHTTTRNLEKLLEETVFFRYSTEVQCLLVQISILSHIDEQQAAFICGDESAPYRLRCLSEDNAFLRYSPGSGQYFLHGIFRSFLDKLPASEYGVDKTLVRRRAAEWSAAQGDYLQAIRFFIAAGQEEDLLRILELFESSNCSYLLFIAPEEIIDAIKKIPWRLRMERPLGYLAFLYFYITVQGAPEAISLLEEADRLFETETTISPETRSHLKGEIILIHSILAFNRLPAMRDAYENAHKALGGRSRISTRHLIWTFGSPHVSYLYLREPGEYKCMIDLIQSNLHYYHDLSDGCSMGAEDLFHAEYLLETGKLVDVERHILLSITLGQSREQYATIVAAKFSHCRLATAQRRIGDCLELLQQLSILAEKAGRVVLSNCADLATGYIYACLGNYDKIPQWLREGNITPARAINQIFGFIQIVHGKALLLSGDYPRLEAVAHSIPVYQGSFNNIFGLIHAKVMEAIAVQHLHGMDEALNVLHEALKLARPDGIALSLAEYGDHLLPMLKKLSAQKPADHYIERLLHLCHGMSKTAAEFASSVASPGSESGRERIRKTRRSELLTQREKQILSLAAKGKKNAAIASSLGITPITVGKALSSIYTKLKAKNRAEAVFKFLQGNK